MEPGKSEEKLKEMIGKMPENENEKNEEKKKWVRIPEGW